MVRFRPDERDVYEGLTEKMRLCRATLLSSGEVRAEPVGAFYEDVARLARGDGALASTPLSFLSSAGA
ncbi:MAG: hypothetical protein EXR69_09735 [Myxococcales bacterium]|nr:hypothetical protein [Myxococcales bacterium]